MKKLIILLFSAVILFSCLTKSRDEDKVGKVEKEGSSLDLNAVNLNTDECCLEASM